MRLGNLLFKLLLAGACGLFCASCGPHMNVQQNIQPYEKKMPELPPGSVPTRGRLQTLTLLQSRVAANPLPRTPLNIENGHIFYTYYCIQCHGEHGDGNGPVGWSYVPKPTDLSTPRVTSMTDGQLYTRMLIGTGHDPVLLQTVLPEHRWPLVMYLREFGTRTSKHPPTP